MRPKEVGVNGEMFYSSGQAARKLGCSSTYVRLMAREGALPHVRTPVGFLFGREAVDRLAAERAAREPVGA